MKAETASLAPGSMFGSYRIARLVGKGTFGSVYEAHKVPVEKRVALKLLDPKLVNHAEAVARFEREAYATATLEHPNIVTAFDVGNENGQRYLVMEFLDGETLDARITREGFLREETLAELFLPLLSALTLVHERGFVHRDLKPGNIFLESRPGGAIEPKLLDFGMVKPDPAQGHAMLTRKGALLGSPSYMSPEQAEAKAIDPRADVFSLGAILWECATGRRLFRGNSVVEILHRVCNEPVPSPRTVNPDVPPPLEALILGALERDKSQRFQTVREMGALLLACASPGIATRWSSEFSASSTPANLRHAAPTLVDAPPVALGTASEAATIPLDTTSAAPLSAPALPKDAEAATILKLPGVRLTVGQLAGVILAAGVVISLAVLLLAR